MGKQHAAIRIRFIFNLIEKVVEMKAIQIVSGVISFVFSIFAIVFFVILPLTGIHFDYNTLGSSMEPALSNEVTIRLSPKLAPYEDLKVGDIILFRQKDYLESTMPPGEVYAPEWNEDDAKLHLVRQTELEKEPQKYILIHHRIIEINEKGLITKGDNNEYPDFLPVKAEEYQGKIIWHMNNINWLFKAMYKYDLWVVFTILFILSCYLWYKKDSALSSTTEQKHSDIENYHQK